MCENKFEHFLLEMHDKKLQSKNMLST